MKIIVGLGNPGSKYLFTRHNLGFMLIDAIAKEELFQNKHKSHIQKRKVEGEWVLLAKPQTFMNLSGKAVKEILDFYKAPLENLLVIHDDKDQMFGKIKFQKSRGDGGHNGVKSIHQELQSQDYCRLKMGVAPVSINTKEKEVLEKASPFSLLNKAIWPCRHIKKDIVESNIETSKPIRDTAHFILSPFEQKEKEQLPDFLELGLKAVSYFIQKGYEAAANQFNSKEKNL